MEFTLASVQVDGKVATARPLLGLPRLCQVSPFSHFARPVLGSWSLAPRPMPAIAEGTGEQVAVQSHFQAVDAGLRNGKPAGAHPVLTWLGQPWVKAALILVSTIIRMCQVRELPVLPRCLHYSHAS